MEYKSWQFKPGNQINYKLDTIELKQEAFRQYLEHLSKGKSKKSWRMQHPEVCVTWQTMDKYIETEPDVFDPIQIEMAKSDGYAYWEEVAEESAKGINKDANTASLQMVMRNKFGWDKEDKKEQSQARSMLEELMKKVRED